MNKLPSFIIIGAMKCATSTLHEQLALQTGIFMSELKEPNFFSDDDQYARGVNWYLEHFKLAPENAICGESSTHYTKLPTYPHTVDRLRNHLSHAKFIYVMRHPVDRLVSQYIHEWSQRIISTDIDRAIDEHPELIDYSRYTMQLKPYFDVFGHDRILPVFFERLLKHPQEELERICQFIGYSGRPVWDAEFSARNVSGDRMRKSAWRDLLVNTPVLREIRRAFIPKTFRTWIRSLWTMKKKPELNLRSMEHLRQVFNPDLAELGSWLSVELSCESFKEQVRDRPLAWNKVLR